MFVDYSSSDEENEETKKPEVKPVTKVVEEKKSEPKGKTVTLPKPKKKLPDVDQLLGSMPARSFGHQIEEERPSANAEVEDYRNVPPPQFSLVQDAEMKDAAYRKFKRPMPGSFEKEGECPVIDKYQKLNEKKVENPPSAQNEKMKDENIHKGHSLAPTHLKTKRANIPVE